MGKSKECNLSLLSTPGTAGGQINDLDRWFVFILEKKACVYALNEGGFNENTQCLSDSVNGVVVRSAEHLASLHDITMDEAGKQVD